MTGFSMEVDCDEPMCETGTEHYEPVAFCTGQGEMVGYTNLSELTGGEFHDEGGHIICRACMDGDHRE